MLVCGDADAINQVIYNLLENAVKFAQEGSELAISLFKQGEKAYISIKNHGPVIPAEELPLIFDRFHKADKSRSADRDGYGLGLYIVKTILNNHGEDIAITSRDGATEFVFSLTLKQK
ncbi:MAG: ATP-binding protein, partial [Oscillospiraceae bacterium]|nr:ATP-binding protein [Oscillospiraceae bacterium]